jgi:hypothetical protein
MGSDDGYDNYSSGSLLIKYNLFGLSAILFVIYRHLSLSVDVVLILIYFVSKSVDFMSNKC